MRQVKFSPPARDAKWAAWIKEANAETKKNKQLARRDRKIVYKTKLYKKMRQVIFDGFSGKCAYCEAKFILTETGDVDHYRPKGGISDELGQTIMITRPGQPPKPHPGYYWLAYDWHNLLPSCTLCNRPSRPRGGPLIGKGTRFPVLPGSKLKYGHARSPRDLVKELPVFIHPVFENPLKHLAFDANTGLLIDKTPRGKLCIDLLGLNREGLSRERKKIYLSVIAFIRTAIENIRERDLQSLSENLAIIESYRKGTEAYSWAGRVALKDQQSLLRELKKLCDAL